MGDSTKPNTKPKRQQPGLRPGFLWRAETLRDLRAAARATGRSGTHIIDRGTRAEIDALVARMTPEELAAFRAAQAEEGERLAPSLASTVPNPTPAQPGAAA